MTEFQLSQVRIWLDDEREAPEGWTRAMCVNQAIFQAMMAHGGGRFAAISLDHDLGKWSKFGGDGIKFVDFMTEFNVWPTEEIRIHTLNPPGRDNIVRALKAAARRGLAPAIKVKIVPYVPQAHHQ